MKTRIAGGKLSARLFGEPGEMDLGEAEDLIRLVGLEPDAVLEGVALRLKRRARSSPLRRARFFERVLDEIEPGGQREMKFDPEATKAVKRLLEDIQRLPELIRRGREPMFRAAYRSRKELSKRDKEILDGVARELRAKWEKGARERGNVG